MQIIIYTINNIKIAEVISENVIINSVDDGLDFLGNIYYQGFDKMIIYIKNINPSFFDLKMV